MDIDFMMSYEEFKEALITDGERFGGKFTGNNGVLKFLYNTWLVQKVAYCPCRQEQTIDTICPCKPYRDGSGCCCNLFK